MIIVYAVLFVGSFALLLLSKQANAWEQAIMISFAVNILTSILVVLVIDKRMDKKKKKMEADEEKSIELRDLLKQNELIEVLRPIIITHFNQLTIPTEKRIKDSKFQPINPFEFNHGFCVSDLVDLWTPDITVYGALGESELEAFRATHNKIMSAFEVMLTSSHFKYYPEVKSSLINITKVSLKPHCMESMLFLSQNQATKKTMIDMMKAYSGNPEDDLRNNRYDGNLLLNPLLFFSYLVSFGNALEEYFRILDDVIKEK